VWRELMREAPAPLLAVDHDGVVQLASDGAARLLGCAEEEIVGQRLIEVLPSDMDTEESKVDGWTVIAPRRQGQDALLVDLIGEMERERARIAAGIHDDSLQVITAAMLRLQQLRHRLRDPEALVMLGRLEESISLAADRLRRLIFDFRPTALERSGLSAAVRETMARMRDDYGLEVVLRDDLPAQPPMPVRVLLFRIAQEALANVVQHAQASRVEVTLAARGGGYLVSVADDGVGVSGPAKPGHLGITLMSERAEFACGWFRMDSKPGAGTTVTAWIPAGRCPDD
jgi:signal transduction histidine kinase